MKKNVLLKMLLILLIVFIGIYSICYKREIPVMKNIFKSTSESEVFSSRAGYNRKEKVIKVSQKNNEQKNIIKIVSYNIHRGVNKKGILDIEAIVEQIRFSGADIIGLQEVERFSVRTRFQDQIQYIADKLSMEYVYGKSLNILNGQYGNAIISKYPIEEYETIELPYQGERRTILKAIINVDGVKIDVYNTHLGLEHRERTEQLKAIMEEIKENRTYKILMGDFNAGIDEMGAIIEDLVDCADDSETATFENDKGSARIDYVFVSENFFCMDYKVIKSDASDHDAVLCEIKIK